MFDPQKLLEQFLGGTRGPEPGRKGMSPDFIKGLATGGAAGGLAGILLGGKTSKKMAKGVVKLGGSAALAGLAHVRTVEPLQTADAFPAYRIVGTDASDNDLCPAIYDLARQRNWPLRELRRDVRTLESVFNLLATGGDRKSVV